MNIGAFVLGYLVVAFLVGSALVSSLPERTQTLGALAALGVAGYILLNILPAISREASERAARQEKANRERELHEAKLANLKAAGAASVDGESSAAPAPRRDRRDDSTSAAAAKRKSVGGRGDGSGGGRSDAVVGRLLGFGQAHYQHDPEEEPSFFVTLRRGKEELVLWGLGLEEALAKAGAAKGQKVALTRTGKKAVTVKAKRIVDGKKVIEDVQAYRQSWRCTVQA